MPENPPNRNSGRVVISAGEPAGTGPDLCIQLAQRPSTWERVVAADPELLEERARRLGLPLSLTLYRPHLPPRPQRSGELAVLPVTLRAPAIPGELNRANAAYVLESLQLAIRGCLEGEFSALVTAPVHKGIINAAGIPFTGHTEYLAALTNTSQVVMMLATEGLRVALATTHLPLNRVAGAITSEHLERTIRILHREMARYFCSAAPRILVSGLNPHAGEDGHLGREEQEVIQPLLERLRTEGLRLRGPLPADSLFIPQYLEEADVVLTMYHDQGLPVLKHLGFGRAANITLGLPIIRTSVDHGTALELAGSGRASCGSLEYALQTAQEMARRAAP